MNKVKWLNMPATQIYMRLAPMMAKARGWKVGLNFEAHLRMVNEYIRTASQLN